MARRKPQSGPGRGQGPHRPPPPERTGLEDSYLRDRRQGGDPLSIHTTDGRTLSGTLAGFSPDTLRLHQADGPEIVVRKRDIRYIEDS
jgi:sRNA-binding regulator protein Hfq